MKTKDHQRGFQLRLIYNNNCNSSADYYYNNLRKNICQDDNISIK